MGRGEFLLDNLGDHFPLVLSILDKEKNAALNLYFVTMAYGLGFSHDPARKHEKPSFAFC